jgi:hypothetical protein
MAVRMLDFFFFSVLRVVWSAQNFLLKLQIEIKTSFLFLFYNSHCYFLKVGLNQEEKGDCF